MLKDRVKVFSNTDGTGTLTLGATDQGFQSFNSISGQTYYAITNGINWEVGIGTHESGNLSRDTVLESSNSGNLINLSGRSTIFVTYPASRAIYLSPDAEVSSGDILVRGSGAWDSRPLSSGDVSTALGYSPSVATSYSANSGIILSNNNFSMGGTGTLESLVIIGETAPENVNNSLYSDGSDLYWEDKRIFQNKIVQVSGEYTLAHTDNLVIINSGNLNLFPPSGTEYSGFNYTIKALIENAQIIPVSGTVDGSSGVISMRINDCYKLTPTNAGWYITSKYSEFIDGNP